MPVNVQTAIEHFWTARARGEYFPQTYFDRLTLDDAYRIQLGIVDRRVAAGEHHIGWKVGLTAKVIQEQFGFHAPVFACILETKPSGHVFGATELIHPGFETELCVRLGRALEGAVTQERVRAAVDIIHPSFEIIETRGDLVKQIAVALADNGQQRSAVIGAPVRLMPTMALDQITARVQLNGQEVATGLGSAVLGNPLNSIAWLVDKLGQYGRQLRPGDIIMTGSFVRQFPLGPGDVAVAEFSGIGRVEVKIAVDGTQRRRGGDACAGQCQKSARTLWAARRDATATRLQERSDDPRPPGPVGRGTASCSTRLYRRAETGLG
jgi:2-keto-4-pentenoate hydratase